ncbi:leucine--tRNA ligase [Candidatus Parcubacteria bacterium]|jgi:leucyl-tRNA synthetase|nr:MAG: leucine--tRNA ligase [Candidatus Parcubacteria bacterium]
MKKYDFQKIDKKWQKEWGEKKLYKAEDFSTKKKWYSLVEFPYPSGQGLHVGHVRSYTALDVLSRKRRMEGYNVLYPIGWDAFGLPTENYAVKTGIHPVKVTKDNTDTFRRQLKAMGFSFDWEREINTTDPEYYKWTQWIFLQFFKHNLAYKTITKINWCPSCKIGLANEEVVSGSCERCGSGVEEKEKEQWMLKITAYADKLLEGLESIDYLPEIKRQQENWIGRSEGAEIDFRVSGTDSILKVFTTRPDTLYGATYMVVSPEHKIISELKNRISNIEEIESYILKAKKKTEEERIENKEKTGVEIKGIKAINPVNDTEIQIFVADYVLSGYGTGAIMAVPAHDERDFEFAKKFSLPVIVVISDGKIREQLTGAYIGTGTLINSGPCDGMDIEKAKEEIIKRVHGVKKVQYHLRDWVFSRQRYWGEPIPVVKCERCGYVAVPEKDLPIELPNIKDFKPRDDGESPLASVESWVHTTCPACGGAARRETDVMPNWAGSSWYFLRYIDPKNKDIFADPKKLQYWMQVDWYNGGMEHVTLHLLYSRFWNQFLFDIGVVPTLEPYTKRTAHGMVLGEGGVKMSKSRGNVINPDDVIKAYGADTLRLYEMFMGPFNQSISWDSKSIEGTWRFLNRVWSIAHEKKFGSECDKKVEQIIEKTVKKVGEDIEKMAFNTAISTMMICANECYSAEAISRTAWEKYLKVLAPFAPHITEELWSELGNEKSLHISSWPEYDQKKIIDDTFTLVIQVNGKTRATIETNTGISEKDAKELALKQENVSRIIEGQEIKKVIFVSNRLINFVI